MIQRIQTIWLAVVVLLTAATFFFPIAVFDFDFKSMSYSETYGLLDKKATEDYIPLIQQTPAWSLLFMQVGVALIALIAIFLYKNRQLQIRIVAFGFLLLAVYTCFMFFFKIDGLAKEITQYYSAPKITYGVSAYFPMLQIILMMLAQRAIKKDEKLVRASDRLR